MINGIGGIQVLFPLLEQVNKGPLPDTDSLPQPLDLGAGMDPVQEPDDWVVVPSSSYSGKHCQGYNQGHLYVHVYRILSLSSPQTVASPVSFNFKSDAICYVMVLGFSLFVLSN